MAEGLVGGEIDRSNSRELNVTIDDKGAPASATLRTQVASGVRWGIIVSIGTQVGRIVFLVALMRLLGPWNFGIVGQAAVVVGVGQIFLHFGLAVSLVQRPVLKQSEVGAAFWLNIAMGFLLASLVGFGAPLLAIFFKSEELTAVLRVLSITFLLKGMTVVPIALLTRNMQFRTLGVVEITSTCISGIFGVGAAAMGAGYWALVVQIISLEAISMILILHINGIPNLTWSAAAARDLWSFSSRVMGADLVNYISDSSDRFLVARFLGPTPLALYSLAFRVPQLTLAVLAQAGRVVLPMFARLQDDRKRLVRAYLEVTESVSLVLCPSMTLTILVAPVGVSVVFGEAWDDAVLPLQIIAAMTVQYALGAFMGPLTIAVGRADWEFRWSMVTMIMALVAFPIGLQWGIVGVAWSYLIILSVQNPVRFMVIQRLVPISARSCVRALAPALTCSVVLAAVWFLTEALLQGIASARVIAAVASVASAAAYVVALRVAWPDDFRRQLEFARLVACGEAVRPS